MKSLETNGTTNDHNNSSYFSDNSEEGIKLRNSLGSSLTVKVDNSDDHELITDEVDIILTKFNSFGESVYRAVNVHQGYLQQTYSFSNEKKNYYYRLFNLKMDLIEAEDPKHSRTKVIYFNYPGYFYNLKIEGKRVIIDSIIQRVANAFNTKDQFKTNILQVVLKNKLNTRLRAGTDISNTSPKDNLFANLKVLNRGSHNNMSEGKWPDTFSSSDRNYDKHNSDFTFKNELKEDKAETDTLSSDNHKNPDLVERREEIIKKIEREQAELEKLKREADTMQKKDQKYEGILQYFGLSSCIGNDCCSNYRASMINEYNDM